MRCHGGCALGVKNSTRGTLVLDSEPKDKQTMARRVARGKEVRSALLIMLFGYGGGALHRFECGRGVALRGGCGGRRGKKNEENFKVCFIQSPHYSRMRASKAPLASLVPYFSSKVKTAQSHGTFCTFHRGVLHRRAPAPARSANWLDGTCLASSSIYLGNNS